MKKIIFLLITTITIFITYKNFSKKNIQILSLGDTKIENIDIKKVKNYKNITYDTIKVTELTSNIYNNKQSIKTNLAKSSILFLSVGKDDIKNILNNSNNHINIYNEIDDIIKNYKELITQIKKYARGKIIVLGVYEKDIDKKYLKYFNNELKYILDDDIYYIDFNKYLNYSKTKKEIINVYLNNGLIY